MSDHPWDTGVDDTSAESWATPGQVIDKLDREIEMMLEDLDHPDRSPRAKVLIAEVDLQELRLITRHVRGIHPEWWNA